jgi:hypothetical protein
MKILWVSKHHPLYTQEKELKRLFGQNTVIDIFDQPYAKPSVVVSQYRKGSYNELVVIAPLSVCRTIVSFGLKPLYAEMEQVPEDSPLVELEVNNQREQNEGRKRYYRFVKFRRIEKLELVFSELDS